MTDYPCHHGDPCLCWDPPYDDEADDWDAGDQDPAEARERASEWIGTPWPPGNGDPGSVLR